MVLKMKNIFLLVITLLFSVSVQAESIADLFQHSGAPIGGNPDGKITIVEFFDYRCSACVHLSAAIDDIVKSNSDVRILYIDYPILGEISDTAARAALAANMQGKYQELNQTLLMGNQLYSEDVIFQTAKLLGLDVDKIEKDIASDSITEQLKKNYKFANEFNIHSTPAFIVGKSDASDINQVKFIIRELSQEKIEEAISEVSHA